MSRVAKMPVKIPAGVTVSTEGGNLIVKGAKASLSRALPAEVVIDIQNGEATISESSRKNNAMISGTVRALMNNMVEGVTKGFERKLQLVGVGYKAQAKGQVLSLALGFSHPVDYELPAGIVAETPSQTDILIKGIDKQLVGQVAAEIRDFRPPEPYKGKGVRYSDEVVLRKEAKKK